MRWTLAIVLAFVLLALPAPAAPRTDSSTQTIRLISKTVRYRTLVDRPPKGEPNKGDVDWAKSILNNASYLRIEERELEAARVTSGRLRLSA